MFECKKCGDCCQNVGRNFWMFCDHPMIRAMAKRLPFGPDSGEPCDMLSYNECLLQKHIGTKPAVCSKFFCEKM